ncbi:MAG: hypothetical protein IT555_07465 [Acetobacteraceae bacterium]|nr:hypothetical protein [Acetobacteraceae bacterium]
MTTPPDDRIPLRFASSADAVRPGEALLVADGAGAGPAGFGRGGGRHLAGCACCGGRGAVAVALGALLRDRALGRVAWFCGVVVVVAEPDAVADELRGDRLVAARFRVLR